MTQIPRHTGSPCHSLPTSSPSPVSFVLPRTYIGPLCFHVFQHPTRLIPRHLVCGGSFPSGFLMPALVPFRSTQARAARGMSKPWQACLCLKLLCNTPVLQNEPTALTSVLRPYRISSPPAPSHVISCHVLPSLTMHRP